MKSRSLGLTELWESAPRWRAMTALAAISTALAVIFWPATGASFGNLGGLFSTSSPGNPSVTPSPAARQEDALEQYNRGVMYFKGEGVPVDKAEAARWYRKAAELGLAQAQFNLAAMNSEGNGIPKNKAEAVHWYRKAAEQGNIHAQFALGVLYYAGDGIPENKAEAAQWFRKAAEQGDTDAQNNLGVMYSKGEGVPEDKAEAIRWFRKAAGQ